jgi:hypothetical protein
MLCPLGSKEILVNVDQSRNEMPTSIVLPFYLVSLALRGYLIASTFCIIVQIESHIKRLDEDLGQFAEDLKHGISSRGRC